MKRFLGLVAGLGLALAASSASAQVQLRLFFSTQGWESAQAAPGLALGNTNPEVTNSGRLYLWAQVINGTSSTVWNGVGLNIDTDGDAQITALSLYTPQWENPDGDLINRWTSAFPGNPAPPTAEINGINMTAVGINGEFGVRGAPRPDGFVNSTGLGGEVLLGYIDVQGTDGTVWLEVGNAGISRRSGNVTNDRIFFGFGDDGLAGNAFGSRSAVADARIVPEPASLLLLGLAGLALRRR
jgi:hypothetical protein